MMRIHASVTLLTSRGALVGSRASTPLTFLLSHTFREAFGQYSVTSHFVLMLEHYQKRTRLGDVIRYAQTRGC
jgi:hypothetical protein